MCSTGTLAHGENLRHLFAVIYRRMIHLIVKQALERIQRLVQYWTMKNVVYGGGEEVSKAVQVSWTEDKYLTLDG